MHQRRSKDLIPVGSALDDRTAMPDEIKGPFGAALRFVQNGGRPADARSFGEGLPREVMKLAEDFDTDTYRAAYGADFPECVYLLHVFKKKSASGIGTPQRELNTIAVRYKAAVEHYRRHYGKEQGTR